MRLMETPVPIPNTMVKRMSADDTWLETTWESRWLPDFKKQKNSKGNDRGLYRRYPERPEAKLEAHSFISYLDP